MKLKLLALAVPMIGLLAVPAFAKSPDLGRIDGTVSYITDSNAIVDSQNSDINILFNNDTIFIRDGQVVDATAIGTSDEIIVKYVEQGIAPAIYPPQVTAKVVLIQGSSLSNVFVGRLSLKDESLFASDNSIRIPVKNEGIRIYNAYGNEENIALKDLDEVSVAVIYEAASFSIPAIPLRPIIFVLDDQSIGINTTTKETDNEDKTNEENKNNENKENENNEIKVLEVERSQVSNFLDLLPFWAGGSLGDSLTRRDSYPTAYSHTETAKKEIGNTEIVEGIEDIIDDNFFIGIEVLVEEIVEEIEKELELELDKKV